MIRDATETALELVALTLLIACALVGGAVIFSAWGCEDHGIEDDARLVFGKDQPRWTEL